MDPRAIEKWRVPEGMTSKVLAFEAREGGQFRVSLTYDRPGETGKTSQDTDTYHGRFVKLVANQQVVEAIEFESTDPAMQGEMTITYTLTPSGEGTDLVAVHDGLPPGLSASDNETGWNQALARLAALVEGEHPKGRRARAVAGAR